MGWDFLLRSKFLFSSLVNREREITFFFEFVTLYGGVFLINLDFK